MISSTPEAQQNLPLLGTKNIAFQFIILIQQQVGGSKIACEYASGMGQRPTSDL
jgi:hypothetical protein